MEVVYDFCRGSVGLALVVAGVSLWINPERAGVFRSLGTIFFCTGSLFTLSGLDPLYSLPYEVGNLAVVALVYFVGLATFETFLFIFGDARNPELGPRVKLVGAVWSLVLWLVPLADVLLPWHSAAVSMEEGHPVGVLHQIAGWLVYLWPIAILVIAARGTRSGLRDVPSHSRAGRVFLTTLLAVLAVLVTVVLAALAGSLTLYRLAHTILEAVLVAWYLYAVRFPEAFQQFRREIEEQHQEKLAFEESEAAIIAERLGELVDQRIFCDPRLDLEFLARRIRVPAYRLSQYFNRQLKTSFSTWLNGRRLELIKQQLVERPASKVLDLAFEAGYSSKSIFYSQFRKAEGTSPADYRLKHGKVPRQTLVGSAK